MHATKSRKHIPKVEEPDAVKLIDAYNELSKMGFAVWIRLCLVQDIESYSFAKLRVVLNYKSQVFNDVLLHLKECGYIELRRYGNGKKGSVSIIKRPLLTGFDRFIKLN